MMRKRRTTTTTTTSHRADRPSDARRSWTRALARGAVLTMSVLAMVIAAVGCSGTLRFNGRGMQGEVTITRDSSPTHTVAVTRCGEGIYDGRPIELYCDAYGRLVMIKDLTTGRWYRVSGPHPMLPPDVPHFTFDGLAYTLPPEPAEPILSLPDASNEEILEEWGGAIQPDGSIRAAGTWQYDRGLDRLDLAICLDGTTPLPEPDAFPLAYELIVLLDRDLPLMLHRVVGDRSVVLAYVTEMGVSTVEVDVDGSGPVPGGLIELLRRLWTPPGAS